MRAMFSLLLGAFWPLSEPLFRMVNPAADTAADFNKSRRCICTDPLVYIVSDSGHYKVANHQDTDVVTPPATLWTRAFWYLAICLWDFQNPLVDTQKLSRHWPPGGMLCSSLYTPACARLNALVIPDVGSKQMKPLPGGA